MTAILVFHSVLGVRPGVHAAADRMRSWGHDVRIVDQYDGKVFDDYGPASEYVESVGFPSLMGLAEQDAEAVSGPIVVLGFSNGAGMAEYVAAVRPDVLGVVMVGGALDPAIIGVSWPAGVPGQVHTTLDDPFRDEGIDATVKAAAAAGATIEVFDYPGRGHLFADPSKQDEYQEPEAQIMWQRVLEFVARVG